MDPVSADRKEDAWKRHAGQYTVHADGFGGGHPVTHEAGGNGPPLRCSGEAQAPRGSRFRGTEKASSSRTEERMPGKGRRGAAAGGASGKRCLPAKLPDGKYGGSASPAVMPAAARRMVAGIAAARRTVQSRITARMRTPCSISWLSAGSFVIAKSQAVPADTAVNGSKRKRVGDDQDQIQAAPVAEDRAGDKMRPDPGSPGSR